MFVVFEAISFQPLNNLIHFSTHTAPSFRGHYITQQPATHKGEKKMTTDIVVIGVKDIMKLYGFTNKEVYALLSTKGCPVLPRKEGAPFKVIKDEFERWLRSRRA